MSLFWRYPRDSFVPMLTVVVRDKLLRPLPTCVNALETTSQISMGDLQ